MSDLVDQVEPGAEGRMRLVELQRLLLPAELPTIGCTEAAASYRAHNHELELGGDWYDLIDRANDQTVVAIVGDVVGHGVEQIGVMGQLRAASNALCGPCAEPHEILGALDRFAETIPGASMTTVAVLVLDDTLTARFASAGHPFPLHVSRGGDIEIVDVGRRAPLTIGSAGSTGLFDFEIGDVIVLYTDGVVERRNEAIDDSIRALGEFVSERFDLSCREIADAIVDDFGADATDDQAVLVLRPLHDRAPGLGRPHPIPSAVSLGR